MKRIYDKSLSSSAVKFKESLEHQNFTKKGKENIPLHQEYNSIRGAKINISFSSSSSDFYYETGKSQKKRTEKSMMADLGFNLGKISHIQ